MKLQTIGLVLLLLGAPLAVYAQEGQQDMEAMMKLASPGEQHKKLGRMVGDWTYTNKWWEAPGKPPTETTGTMHAEWMLDGRYVHSVWKGDFMGMPFEGHGMDGYDNVAKTFVGTWIDNMGTGIMYSTGSCDDSTNICTFIGDSFDPMSGQKMTFKSVSSWSDDNTYKLEMFAKNPSGETRVMEIVAKRK